MHIVARRKQRVVVPRLERALPNEPKPAVPGLVELLVLIALVEADQSPGEMIVHRCHRPRRDDEAEQAEGAIGGSKQEPLADATAHPALRRILLEPLWQPIRAGEEFPERWPEQPTGLGCRPGPLDGRAHAVDEAADDRRIEDPLVLFERSSAW